MLTHRRHRASSQSAGADFNHVKGVAANEAHTVRPAISVQWSTILLVSPKINHLVGNVGVLPRLREVPIIPEHGPIVVPQLAVLGVLDDRIVLQVLGDLHLCLSVARDLKVRNMSL